jgi:hypothetical protein
VFSKMETLLGKHCSPLPRLATMLLLLLGANANIGLLWQLRFSPQKHHIFWLFHRAEAVLSSLHGLLFHVGYSVFLYPPSGWPEISVLFHTGCVRDWLPCAQQEGMEGLWCEDVLWFSKCLLTGAPGKETRYPLPMWKRVLHVCHLLNVFLHDLLSKVPRCCL